MIKTPLYDTHVALGGKIVEFSGFALPVQYVSILEEHKAVRENCGLFDVSHMGEIRITGKRSFDYLQNLLTNDISSLRDGGCRYSLACYEHGGVVDDVIVYKFSDEDYLIIVNAGNIEKDHAWFAAHAIPGMTLQNESEDWAQLALQGPAFLSVLCAAGFEGVLPEKRYTFTPGVKIHGIPCLVSRTGYTGEDGVELYCAPKDATLIFHALMDAGAPLGMLPCGLGARDVLRFEASMPLYGHELREDILALESGLDFAVKLEKPNFIGKDALIKNGPPKRTRIGLELLDRGIAREGLAVFAREKEIGFVTSGGVTPSLGKNYAMALIDKRFADEETYEIELRGRRLCAKRVPLPFYKRTK